MPLLSRYPHAIDERHRLERRDISCSCLHRCREPFDRIIKTSLAIFIKRRALGISVDALPYGGINDAGLEMKNRMSKFEREGCKSGGTSFNSEEIKFRGYQLQLCAAERSFPVPRLCKPQKDYDQLREPLMSSEALYKFEPSFNYSCALVSIQVHVLTISAKH